jgi:hypothetical protein
MLMNNLLILVIGKKLQLVRFIIIIEISKRKKRRKRIMELIHLFAKISI